MSTKFFSCVFSITRNRAIGFRGKLAYESKHDLKLFKAITTRPLVSQPKVTQQYGEDKSANCVIMGKKTWQDIARRFPLGLPMRQNIVISQTLHSEESNPPCTIFPSLNHALSSTTISPNTRFFIIGGKRLFEEGMQDRRCKFLFITRFLFDAPGDVFLHDLEIGEAGLEFRGHSFYLLEQRYKKIAEKKNMLFSIYEREY